jgi:hypothetical protein
MTLPAQRFQRTPRRLLATYFTQAGRQPSLDLELEQPIKSSRLERLEFQSGQPQPLLVQTFKNLQAAARG